MMSIRSVTPLLGLAILCSAAARGGDDWPPYFVGEVVVVAESDDPTAGPGTVTVLEADDIRRLGAATVADAVQHLAGASISVGARDEQRIWVRGYEPADVLVLLDGIPIADPYSGEVDLGQVPVGDVARIVLSRGAASPEYGPGGWAGSSTSSPSRAPGRRAAPATSRPPASRRSAPTPRPAARRAQPTGTSGWASSRPRAGR